MKLRLRILMVSVFLFGFSGRSDLYAYPGILADIPSSQANLATGSGIQALNTCASCHQGGNNSFNSSNDFRLFDSSNNELELGQNGDIYTPGETYRVVLRSYLPSYETPDMPPQTAWRGLYVVRFGGPGDMGVFNVVPGSAYGDNQTAVSHFINVIGAQNLAEQEEVNLLGSTAEVEFDWIAPAAGTTVIFRVFTMGTNGDGNSGGDHPLSAPVSLTLLGPLSGTSADIPDLIDPSGGGDGSGSSGGDDSSDANAGSSVRVTSFSGGCAASLRPPQAIAGFWSVVTFFGVLFGLGLLLLSIRKHRLF